jgi:uncharacterized RDD family membrane protein YckC
MLKKYSPQTKITATTIAIAIVAILSCVFKYGESEITREVKSVIQPFNLSWFNSGWEYYVGYTVNYFHLLSGLLLLTGAIIYWATKYKEATLIRFFLSVIFLSRLASMSMGIVHWLFIREKEYTVTDHLVSACFMLICAGYLFLCYKISRYFNQINPADTEVYGEGDAAFAYLVPASKWGRTVNRLIDCLTGILIFSPIVLMIGQIDRKFGFLLSIVILIGERGTLYLLIFICATFYYFFSEWLLGGSPAKFFTGTRVTSETGNSVPAGSVAVRTLSRFIPFDALSFIFSQEGWHDSISKTKVVKEKPTGFSKTRYLVIIPIALIMLYIANLLKAGLEDYKREQETVVKKEVQKTDVSKQLGKLNTNDFLTLMYNDDYSDKARLFLKVEQVRNGSISFSKLYPGENQINTQPALEQLYLKEKDTLKSISLTPGQIIKAFRGENDYSVKTIGLNIDGEAYAITEIKHCFGPNVKLVQASIRERWLSLQLKNAGWNASLVSATTIEGNVQLLNHLPSALPTTGKYNSYTISASIEESDKDFKINLIIADSLGRNQTYQVSGNGKNASGVVMSKLN